MDNICSLSRVLAAMRLLFLLCLVAGARSLPLGLYSRRQCDLTPEHEVTWWRARSDYGCQGPDYDIERELDCMWYERSLDYMYETEVGVIMSRESFYRAVRMQDLLKHLQHIRELTAMAKALKEEQDYVVATADSLKAMPWYASVPPPILAICIVISVLSCLFPTCRKYITH